MRKATFAAVLSLFGSTLVSAPATAPNDRPCNLTVLVPVGASLTVNGVRTEQMTAVRKFISPDLPPGQKFYYTFVASYTQDGEGVMRKKQVEVTAGATIKVDMSTADIVGAPRPKISTPVSPFDSPKTEAPKKPEKKKRDGAKGR